MVQAETILDFGFWIQVKISNLKQDFKYGANQNTYTLVIIDTDISIDDAKHSLWHPPRGNYILEQLLSLLVIFT